MKIGFEIETIWGKKEFCCIVSKTNERVLSDIIPLNITSSFTIGVYIGFPTRQPDPFWRTLLYFNSGPGPFPGIIDMFGHAGGLMDFRAALFASHGFAAFSLPFYAFEDLTPSLENIELEYCDVSDKL